MKRLVNLSVPSVGIKVDMRIPMELSVIEVKKMIIKSLDELTSHQYCSEGEEILCVVEKKTILREKYTLLDYDIKDGDHLLLM